MLNRAEGGARMAAHDEAAASPLLNSRCLFTRCRPGMRFRDRGDTSSRALRTARPAGAKRCAQHRRGGRASTPTAPAASYLSNQESTCLCSRIWSSVRTSGTALNDYLFVLSGNEFRLVKTLEIGSETLTVSIIGLG